MALSSQAGIGRDGERLGVAASLGWAAWVWVSGLWVSGLWAPGLWVSALWVSGLRAPGLWVSAQDREVGNGGTENCMVKANSYEASLKRWHLIAWKYDMRWFMWAVLATGVC